MRREGTIGDRLWGSCLVVIICLISLSTSSIIQIRLAPSGGPPWNGQCNSSGCESQACSFSGSINPNSATASCSIIFSAGSYTGIPFIWTNNGIASDTNVSFAGDVYNLDIQLATYPSPVAINASRYTIYHSSITLATSATTFSVFEGNFVNTSMNIVSSTVALYTIKSMQIGPIDSAQSVITLLSYGIAPNVSISYSVLTCSDLNGAFLRTSKLDQLILTVAAFRGPSLVSVTDPALVTAVMGPNSFISFNSSHLIDVFRLKVTISSDTTVSYLGAYGGALTSGGLTRANLGPSSTLSKVDLQCAGACSFTALQAVFVDCEVALGTDSSTLTSHSLVQSTFNITNRGKLELTALDPTAPSFNIRYTTVNIEPFQFLSEPFVLSGSPLLNMSTTSSLTTNALWMTPGTELKIGNLTVTTSISTTLVGIREATIIAHKREPGYLWPTVWNFSSIVVSKTILDMTDLDMMAYTVSSPSDGIQNDLAALSPFNLSVAWATPITATYPLIANITSPPRGFAFSYPPHPGYNLDITFNHPALLMRHDGRDLLPSMILPNSACPPLPYPDGFNCVNGILVAYGSIEAPYIVLPPSAGVVQVLGNVTLSGSLIFSGTGATLNVSGCAVLPSVEINLEGQKDPSKGLPADSIVLLSQDTSCQNSLLNTPISVKQDPKTCKKVTASQDEVKSTSSTLAVLFSVDDGKCSSNTKWIILGSVLGAVVLILAVLALLFTFNEKAKMCIRPFVARGRSPV